MFICARNNKNTEPMFTYRLICKTTDQILRIDSTIKNTTIKNDKCLSIDSCIKRNDQCLPIDTSIRKIISF